MGKLVSPYYPPRARWYGAVFDLGAGVRRRLALDRIGLPGGVSFSHLLGGVLVPGLAVWLRGPRLWGRAAMGASVLLLTAFVVWLGRPLGNVAFGLLISLHGTGLIYLLEPWLAGSSFRFRILCSLGMVVGLSLVVYMPARGFVERNWVMPMQINGRTLIVRVIHRAAGELRLTPGPGQWMAYSLAAQQDYHDGVYVLAGFGLGPVLARPGDRVRFTESALVVNGKPQPRLANMPTAGELVVPEKHWLVWPDVAIGGHGYGPEANLSAILLQMATISEDQFIGKPFKRWFWRRQLPA